MIKASGTVQGAVMAEDPRTREELLEAVNRLEEQVFNLRFRQRAFEALEKENARLRVDLGFKQNRHYDVTIPAQVIKRTRTSWWSTVTINRGRRHQVTKDLPVISREHAVVGKITATGLTDDTAEVLLLTDEQCSVAARIGRSVSMQGIVQGYRGLGNLTPEVRLTYLDPDISLPAGAILYTDDFEGQVFPPDLLIGRVVRQVKGELFDSAIIDPQVDFTRLDSVFVIRMSEEGEGENDGEQVNEEDATEPGSGVEDAGGAEDVVEEAVASGGDLDPAVVTEESLSGEGPGRDQAGAENEAISSPRAVEEEPIQD